MKATVLHAKSVDHPEGVGPNELAVLEELAKSFDKDSDLRNTLLSICTTIDNGRPVIMYSWDGKK